MLVAADLSVLRRRMLTRLEALVAGFQLSGTSAGEGSQQLLVRQGERVDQTLSVACPVVQRPGQLAQ